MARATGAPVYCPAIEAPVLADIMSYVPWPGFGPFESYDADVLLRGGERLDARRAASSTCCRRPATARVT